MVSRPAGLRADFVLSGLCTTSTRLNVVPTAAEVKLADGKKGSLFDALEDLDSSSCLEKVKTLNAMQRHGEAL